MPRLKRSRIVMSPVHANAAAIDISATLHVAAVGPDRVPGAHLRHLHRRPEPPCRLVQAVRGQHSCLRIRRRLLDPRLRDLEQRGFAVLNGN
jgi:hypothetical protein